MSKQVTNPPTTSQQSPTQKPPSALPPDFDPAKYPHYSVQSSIYSLLISALGLAENYERMPGREGRWEDLDTLIKKYLETCDLIKMKQPPADARHQ